MSERREEEAPDSMEEACVLCGRAAADPVLCGQKINTEDFCAHFFCLIFASELFYWQDEESGMLASDPNELCRTVVRAAQKKCFVCGERGAAITCCWEGCDRSFHLPCAMEGECITQYFALHSSFCREHRPEQEVEAAPENTTECLICLEPVEDRKSYRTMVCPACKHAWFHRGCIQGQAVCADISFSCPLCRDKRAFLVDMLTMGIRIPLRNPSQDNEPPDEELIQRHSRCDARECLCPGGREQAEERGPWELLLCSSCAAEGTHRRCSNLRTSRTSWECESCADRGTDSSDSSELAASGTGSRSGSGSSHNLTAQDSSSSSTGSQVTLEPSHDFPVLQGSSSSSSPGPDHRQRRSRVQRQAQTPYSRPRRRQERSRAPAPSAESSTPSQAALGTSHSSPVLESSSPSTASQLPAESSCPSPARESGSSSSRRGPMRIRDRSRVEHRSQNPYSRRGRRHGTSRALSPRAGPDPPPPAQ
ncbi:E3 ubiquitin-protein ligase PHF7-like [Strix aluco]|uniref:E3 ubiquitin-protein ligase PHF7-like n=1 Tax=Strix aluco TaxID=111821 RepID=UPI003DA5BC6F